MTTLCDLPCPVNYIDDNYNIMNKLNKGEGGKGANQSNYHIITYFHSMSHIVYVVNWQLIF